MSERDTRRMRKRVARGYAAVPLCGGVPDAQIVALLVVVATRALMFSPRGYNEDGWPVFAPTEEEARKRTGQGDFAVFHFVVNVCLVGNFWLPFSPQVTPAKAKVG